MQHLLYIFLSSFSLAPVSTHHDRSCIIAIRKTFELGYCTISAEHEIFIQNLGSETRLQTELSLASGRIIVGRGGFREFVDWKSYLVRIKLVVRENPRALTKITTE